MVQFFRQYPRRAAFRNRVGPEDCCDPLVPYSGFFADFEQMFISRLASGFTRARDNAWGRSRNGMMLLGAIA